MLVGSDHQLLDEHVGMRLGLAPGRLDPAVRERERDLRRVDLERAAREPRRPPRGRDLGGKVELLEDLRGRLTALGLAVGQPCVRVDHRAVEDGLAVGRHLDGHAQAVLERPQRAGVVSELVREHRRDETRDVRRERPLRRRRDRVEFRGGRTTTRRRCAPTTGSRRAPGANESASSKSFAVSGSIVTSGSSRRSVRPVERLGAEARTARGHRGSPVRRGAPRARSRCAGRLPRLRSTFARPRPFETSARSPGWTRGPFVSSTIGTPGVKYGSPVTSLPRRRDLDDEAVRGVQTRRKRRTVRPEPSAPRKRPIPSRIRAV